MASAHRLQVSTPSDREICVVRSFDAPQAMVWDAMTQPRYVRRWNAGPPGWEVEACEIDLRVGGRWRMQLRGPAGERMGMSGEHREVVPLRRVVRTEVFEPSWYAGVAVGSMDLSEKDGVTTVLIHLAYDSRETRDAVLRTPMDQGMEMGFQVLDGMLAAGLRDPPA